MAKISPLNSNTHLVDGNEKVGFTISRPFQAFLNQIEALRVKVGSDYIGIHVDDDGVVRIGDGVTNYIQIDTNGDITFHGSAGFYPRFLTQADEPASGSGSTQCDTSEMVVWKDSDDDKVYMCFNDSGTVKTVELA